MGLLGAAMSFLRRGSFRLELARNRLDFTDGGSTLVITFDNAGAPHRQAADRLPWGHKFFTEEGHSVLGVIAHESDWYRSPDLHDALERLRDEGFFARFRSIALTGSSMGGFAATAFASLVPGCHVISYNPQSTLRQDLVPWEKGHPNGRIQAWDGRYADGAVEAAAARVVYLFYDSHHPDDRRHAQRYTSPNVRFMHAPFLGHGLPDSFKDMGMLKDLMRKGIAGTLDDDWYYRSLRARRTLPKYHKELVRTLARLHHHKAGISVCRRAYEQFEDPYFRYREAVFTTALGRFDDAIALLDRFDQTRRAAKRRRPAPAA